MAVVVMASIDAALEDGGEGENDVGGVLGLGKLPDKLEHEGNVGCSVAMALPAHRAHILHASGMAVWSPPYVV